MKFEIQDFTKVAENTWFDFVPWWGRISFFNTFPLPLSAKSGCSEDIFCNFRENSSRSWISNFIAKFYDFCMKTLFSPLNSKLTKLESMHSRYIIYRLDSYCWIWIKSKHLIQLNKYETAPNFIQLSLNLTSGCLLI